MEDENEIIVVAKTRVIDEGKHDGTVANMKFRTSDEGYEYLDIAVTVKDTEGEDVDIKLGFPKYISEGSSFGKFLKATGFDFAVEQEIKLSTIEKHIVGKKLNFQTQNKTSEKGTFATIIKETVKLA